MSEHATAQAQTARAPKTSRAGEVKLQRKCACGQHTLAGGECAECNKKRTVPQRWSVNRAAPEAMLRSFGPSIDRAPETFGETRFGHDFSRVRTHTNTVAAGRRPSPNGLQPIFPSLSTQTRIQRVAENGTGAPSQETTGSVEEAAPTPATTEATTPATEAPDPTTEPTSPAPEAAPSPASAEPGTEPAEPTETAAPALLVEDAAADLVPGQMKKSEFLAQLRSSVCATAEAALAGTGQSTDGCPYLGFWFGYYEGKSSRHVERAIRRYAPETAQVTTAAGYIPLIAARVRQGVETWAQTGEITGVPEDLPLGLLGEGLMGAVGGLASGIGSLFLEARAGGARNAEDPAAIQLQLGDGRPLDGGVRSRMESAFGRSFGHVRTHTDTTAAGLSGTLNARAFTVGEHVAFGAGEYRPGTMIGDALIAHELAHVVQQGSGRASVAPMEVGSAGYNALEKDADKAAVGAMASLWSGAKGALGDIAENAVPRLRSGLRLQFFRCGTTRTARRNQTPSVPAPETAATGPCTDRSLAQTYTPTDQGITASLGNVFGNTSKLAAQMSYGAYSEGGTWHYCLAALTVRIASAVQPVNFRTNIDDANDSDVTDATSGPIIADLRPNRQTRIPVSCAGNQFIDQVDTYSRRRTYWKHQLVVEHEAFHRQDWDNKYRTELIQAEQDVRGHSLPASDASSAEDAIQHERRTLDGFMASAYQRACQTYTPAQESRAYDAGAPRYQQLVDDIQARATREGW